VRAKPSLRGSIRPRIIAGIAVVLAAVGIAFVAEAVLESDAPDGTNLSELTFDRFDGGTGTLAEYEGTPLVVNFFASWCPPCVREMPDFQEVFEDLDGQVAFLGLSQDQSRKAALNLVERTGVTYDVGWDPDLEVYEATGSIAMPTTAFVSPSGELVDTFAGALDAESLNAEIGAAREARVAVLEELEDVETQLAAERIAAERAVLAAAAELAERQRVWESLTAPPPAAEVNARQARVALLAAVVDDRHAALTTAENSIEALLAIARAELALREAGLAEAQAERDGLPADATARERARADANLAAAELAVAQARTLEQQSAGPSGPPHLRGARRDLAAAEADLLAAQAELERLLAGASGVDVAAADAALASAQFEYDLAAAALAALDSGTSPLAADAERLRAEAERLEERIAMLESRSTQLDIAAPYDAIISRVLTVRGRDIAPGDPAIELARATDLVFEAVSTPAQAANLRIDQKVQVTLREFAETPFEGTVVTLPLDTGDPSDKPFIQLAVDWGDQPVTIGLQGVISVLLGASDGVLKVPTSAVWTVNGRSFVETLIDGRRRTLPVTLGMETDDEVEIVHGLTEGDMIFATVRS